MATMTQVTKEDFEVLTKFHSGEIRYFIDFSSKVHARKPTRVTVKRNPGVKRRNRPSHFNARERARIPLRLGKLPNGITGARLKQVAEETVKIFRAHSSMTMRRDDLTKALMDSLDLGQPQISPRISDLIKGGYLEVVADE